MSENIKKLLEEARAYLSQCENREERAQEIREFLLEKPELKENSLRDIEKIWERINLSISEEASILAPMLRDNQISEIMVNGANNIFVEKNGKIERVKDSFFDEKELEDLIRKIGSRINREINENSPILDARLLDGSRIHGVYKNLTGGSCTLTIRKFQEKNMNIDQLINLGTITEEAAKFLRQLMDERYNFFISGGTSSGKTTMLCALVNLINSDERVITVEDSRELNLKDIENLVQLECRQVTNWSGEPIGLDKLIKASLRMRPDRLIVGEIRDGLALINMLSGLNTGHSGMSTGHGNSGYSMIKRMEAFYMQESSFPIESIDEQIASAIDIIIHMKRDINGQRFVEEIGQLYINNRGRIAIKKLFVLDDGLLVRTENQLIKRGED